MRKVSYIKEAVFEILEQSLNSYPKVVVFCWHHDTVEAIKEWCHQKELSYSCITGKTPLSQRENEISRFWNDKELLEQVLTCRLPIYAFLQSLILYLKI